MGLTNNADSRKYQALVEKYMDQGLSKKEAMKKAQEDVGRGSGSDSEDSGDSYSSDDSREMGGRRRRRRHGGAFTGVDSLKTGTIKERIDNAFDLWDNYAPAGSNFSGNRIWQGKALKDWSSVPQQVKDLVVKFETAWGKLKSGAKALKDFANMKGFPEAVKSAVVPQLEAVGFGRSHAKKFGKKMLKRLFILARHGGDKFDDKLNSLGAKGAYDTAKGLIGDIGTKFDAVARPTYNALAYVRDNADTINSGVDAIPGVAASTKTAVKGMVSAVKNSGLGRKGKRAPSKRNMLVSKLMREHGMSLPEASRKASQMMKGGDL
jgi:hypothetical protein